MKPVPLAHSAISAAPAAGRVVDRRPAGPIWWCRHFNRFRFRQGIWQAGLAATLWSAALASGGVESELPVWNDGERAAWLADGTPLVERAPKDAVDALGLAPPTSEDIAASPAGEIPEKYWAAYFAERPRTFLIDPQGLLSAVDSRERLGFLNYHAGDSAIDLFIYVFRADQEIPGEVRAEELAERFFMTGRPAAIVYYHLGAAQRSMLFLSPSLTDAVPAAEQRRALDSSIMQAVAKVAAAGQLEAFLVQMSIRIYWMERMWGGGETDHQAPLPMVKTNKPADKKSAIMAKIQPYLEQAKGFAAPAGAVAGALAVLWVLRWWWRRRARYRFPELPVEPRLGGVHAAGVGAVISFASAAVPLAAQREQVAETLRR